MFFKVKRMKVIEITNKLRGIRHQQVFVNVALFTIVFCFQANVLAQQGTFTIDNLTFNCSNCRVVSDTLCQIPHNGALEVMKCSPDGRSALLREALRSYDGKNPSAKDLTRFLLLPSNEIDLDLAFRLLFIAEGGEVLLEQNARNLTKLRLSVLRELLEAGEGTEKIWKIFWEITTFTASSDEARFKAEIVGNVNGFNLSDLLDDFTAEDLSKESKLCFLFATTVSKFNNNWANQFLTTASILKLCENGINNCGKNIPNFIDPALVSYLNKVRILRVLRGFNEGQLDSYQFLKFLSETDYRTYPIPSATEAIALALKGSVTKEASVNQMIDYFASIDPEIKKMRQNINAQSAPKVSFKRLNWIVVGVILLVVILGLIKRRARNLFLGKEFLPQDNEELRELLSYFNLDSTSSFDDLTKQYHQRAKQFHPDGQDGDNEAFIDLQKKYSRAKELMEKFRLV